VYNRRHGRRSERSGPGSPAPQDGSGSRGAHAGGREAAIPPFIAKARSAQKQTRRRSAEAPRRQTTGARGAAGAHTARQGGGSPAQRERSRPPTTGRGKARAPRATTATKERGPGANPLPPALNYRIGGVSPTGEGGKEPGGDGGGKGASRPEAEPQTPPTRPKNRPPADEAQGEARAASRTQEPEKGSERGGLADLARSAPSAARQGRSRREPEPRSVDAATASDGRQGRAEYRRQRAGARPQQTARAANAQGARSGERARREEQGAGGNRLCSFCPIPCLSERF